MKKKLETDTPPKAEAQVRGGPALGSFLANVRAVKKLTLREVEEATGKEVSNAYLSQLETGKISRPSPNILLALSRVYGVEYATLMDRAGYFTPAASQMADVLRSRQPTSRPKQPSALADEDLSKEEEEKLLEYLAFLRSRRHGRGKGRS